MREASQISIKTVPCLLMVVMILSFWGWMAYGVQIYVNLTESLSHRFFISFRGRQKKVQRKDYVAFIHPLYPNRTLIKRIDGIPGDSIELTALGVTVQGSIFPVRQKEPLKTPVIPKNQYFVSGTHDRSYDSRYESFGLVHRSQIRGVVWPLF